MVSWCVLHVEPLFYLSGEWFHHANLVSVGGWWSLWPCFHRATMKRDQGNLRRRSEFTEHTSLDSTNETIKNGSKDFLSLKTEWNSFFKHIECAFQSCASRSERAFRQATLDAKPPAVFHPLADLRSSQSSLAWDGTTQHFMVIWWSSGRNPKWMAEWLNGYRIHQTLRSLSMIWVSKNGSCNVMYTHKIAFQHDIW